MTSVPHSGAKSVTPGCSVAGGHTPGPWQMGFGPNTGQRCIWGPGDPERTAPWICGEIVNRREFAQGEANARLIASAPCLLDALTNALDALQRLHTDVEALMADSEGVYGLHGNGDQSPWEELREGGQFEDWIGTPLWTARNAWHDGRAAIAKATAGETRNAEPIHRRDGDEG